MMERELPGRFSGGYHAGLAAIAVGGALGPSLWIAVVLLFLSDRYSGLILGPISFGLIMGIMLLWLAGCVVAMLHMVLAMPLYFGLRRRGWVNWFTAGLCGALIGAFPIPLVLWFLAGPVVDWRPAIVCAASGLVAGLTFRAMLRRP